jgi:DNA mismatch repair protein MutS
MIEKDIIRLFDHTHHPAAGERLYQLFSAPSLTLEAVLERQQLLRTFLANWDQLQAFSYHKGDLQEVYLFTMHIEQYNGPDMDLVTQLFSKEKHLLRSRVMQTVAFLKHTFNRYLFKLAGIPGLSGYATQMERFYYALDIEKVTNDITFREAYAIIRRLALCYQQHLTQSFWDSLFDYEAWWSLARGTQQLGFTMPVFEPDTFVIEQFYHPVLSNPVKNDLQLSGNIMILTGPNMSGKSTTLKAIGLCISLAHLGFAVPAAHCRIPFYDQVLIAINVTDDLKNGFSHFMQEIVHVKNTVLHARAGERCFAIFDEVFRGTNIDDALDVSVTTIKGLSQFRHCHFIISTHLYQLKDQLDMQLYEPFQLLAGIEGGMPVNRYKLDRGWSDLKFGKLLFELEGLTDLLR